MTTPSGAFTDSMLKEIKDGMSTLRMTMDVTEYSMNAEWLEALLRRLDCAEEYIAALELFGQEAVQKGESYKAYLRSKGE